MSYRIANIKRGRNGRQFADPLEKVKAQVFNTCRNGSRFSLDCCSVDIPTVISHCSLVRQSGGAGRGRRGHSPLLFHRLRTHNASSRSQSRSPSLHPCKDGILQHPHQIVGNVEYGRINDTGRDHGEDSGPASMSLDTVNPSNSSIYRARALVRKSQVDCHLLFFSPPPKASKAAKAPAAPP